MRRITADRISDICRNVILASFPRRKTPLSQTTWVLWRYDWPFQRGKHTFTVRCWEERDAADRGGRAARAERDVGIVQQNAEVLKAIRYLVRGKNAE
jgi:hypothetical protein